MSRSLGLLGSWSQDLFLRSPCPFITPRSPSFFWGGGTQESVYRLTDGSCIRGTESVVWGVREGGMFVFYRSVVPRDRGGGGGGVTIVGESKPAWRRFCRIEGGERCICSEWLTSHSDETRCKLTRTARADRRQLLRSRKPPLAPLMHFERGYPPRRVTVGAHGALSARCAGGGHFSTDGVAPQVTSDHRASQGADQVRQGRRSGEAPRGSSLGGIEADCAQTRTLQSWSNQRPGRGPGSGWRGWWSRES